MWQAEEEPSTSSASDQTSWKDDNDGFRDTAKGPRRARNLKPGVRKPDLEPDREGPANGGARVDGKLEDGRFQRSDSPAVCPGPCQALRVHPL